MDEKKKNKGSFKSFEELDCWQACRKVRQFISKLLKSYPKDEKYRLADDMIRVSRSITHNIARPVKYNYKTQINWLYFKIMDCSFSANK